MWLQARTLCILSFFSIAILCLSSPAISQFPQDALKQYITDLQKNPNDTSLRERIINLVLNMKSAPPLPEETRKYMARGKAALKGAKEEKDFRDAAEEFKKAVLSAPWLAEGYYNLGIVQDKAGQYSAAIDSLRLYLLAAPAAKDADAVKELIYEIEYRREKAAKESSPEVIAAKKQKEYEAWLKKLDGARYEFPIRSDDGRYISGAGIFEVHGTKIHSYTYYTREEYPGLIGRDLKIPNEHSIVGRVFKIQRQSLCNGRFDCPAICTISEDGNSIIKKQMGFNGEETYVYMRKW